ncbi:OLC1v1033647C1 [Oldenlandia corymbosa var. corymbosa]|uniref:OLC1v1033647C1 n=1 Tax=Oldenlandia corymbosa var. corymbosa TaxID=529605 RepID=A0AAV1CRL9_OLDCO|nr:OLC1v1033647C1 [Oldenlandia corymbosa var. corymbosa]
MAGGNFMYRVMSYVANEVVANGLASNKGFQRFAVKIRRTMESLPEKAAEMRKQIAEQVKEVSETLKNQQ